jgi:hypothetical protein
LRFRALGRSSSRWRFRALFWALNFALLRSRFRAPALLNFSRFFRAPRFFALVHLQSSIFALVIFLRSYFYALNFLSRHWFPFMFPVSFCPSVSIIYTHTYIHIPIHMYKHPTHIHTYVQTTPQRQKSANLRFFSFALGAFAFFRAFFFALPRFFLSFTLASAKARKSAGAQLW